MHCSTSSDTRTSPSSKTVSCDLDIWCNPGSKHSLWTKPSQKMTLNTLTEGKEEHRPSPHHLPSIPPSVWSVLQGSALNWALGNQGWTNPHTAPHHTIEVGAEIETDCSAGGEGPDRQKHKASGRLVLNGLWSSSHLQVLGCPVFSDCSETLDIRES